MTVERNKGKKDQNEKDIKLLECFVMCFIYTHILKCLYVFKHTHIEKKQLHKFNFTHKQCVYEYNYAKRKGSGLVDKRIGYRCTDFKSRVVSIEILIREKMMVDLAIVIWTCQSHLHRVKEKEKW